MGLSRILFWRTNDQIDDARVYNYALTASQARNVYNNGSVNYGPNTGAP